MSTSEMPTLEDSVAGGHSYECKNLEVRYYPDLNEKIMALIEELRESASDKDDEFSRNVRLVLNYTPENMCYSDLIVKLGKIQDAIIESGFSDDEKQCLWQPIAECYAEVRDALREKITPLEKRKSVEVGGAIILPVKVGRNVSGKGVYMEPHLPKFKFVLSGVWGESRSAFRCPEFDRNYVKDLPEDIRGMLTIGKMQKLPLKIVSVGYTAKHSVIVEIDKEALMAMGEVEILED